MGSTLPVATTLLARSPFSTFASFDGSIFELPCEKATATPTMRTITTTTAEMIMIRVRRFFFTFTFPFTKPPSKSGCSPALAQWYEAAANFVPSTIELGRNHRSRFQLDNAAGKMKAGNQPFLHSETFSILERPN
jgi:hypothetical protein